MIGMTEKALGIVAIVGWALALLLGAALWVQTARHANASGQVDRATAARDAATKSAAEWERASGEFEDKLDACNRDRLADRKRDEAAVAAAQAAQRDADRTLRAWLDRYQRATASAECAAIERMPICEVPR